MTILASLARAYERLPDAPPPGCAMQKIGVLIALNRDGSIAGVTDLREGGGKKKTTPLLAVPQPVKRTSGIASNTFWDKTSYVLGVTAGAGKRTTRENEAFIAAHRKLIGGADDPGLIALMRFLDGWRPEMFQAPHFEEEMKDENVAFALEEERLQRVFLHDRPAARALLSADGVQSQDAEAICLVSGRRATISRLHPSIKGVWGGQSSGGSIVSFNLDAFESYGHEQGENAPVSEIAAAAYTGALNTFLTTHSGHRIQIGDASTVFWADASDAETAELAEGVFGAMFAGDAADDTAEAKKVGVVLERVRQGQRLDDLAPGLEAGVRFYVLGLAPNAARLSIRFWFEDDFGRLAANYRRFSEEMRIEPPPREPHPPLWKYLLETASQHKRENVPPSLAGEWMRAILTGARYPMTLLATVLMRMRADKSVNVMRVAILKALLIRNFRKEVPVSLDLDNTNKGYLLGRLFAIYEQTQSAALGRNINATIKDKFYGSASAQPRKVFSLLDRGSANHLSKVGKLSPGRRINLERAIGGVMERMTPGEDPFPASLPAEDQALFGLGYYHQRNEFFRKKTDADQEGETLDA